MSGIGCRESEEEAERTRPRAALEALADIGRPDLREPCDCPACRALSAAIDADRDARAAVRRAARLVDRAHRLDRPVPGERP